MESLLQNYLTGGVFTFMLIFVRVGSALMIMPGIGDMFTPTRVRLIAALGLTWVLTPLMLDSVPQTIPAPAAFVTLLGFEFIIGLLIGMIARIFMSALDIAGMIISMGIGLGNAQLFVPTLASQGSLVGALLSITGMLLLFATNMHHLLFYGVINSYTMFPVGILPMTGGMAELVTKALSTSFLTGFQLAIPFVIISLMIYIGMGILARLMPQVQVFLLALPIQIMLGLTTLFMAISAMMMFWLATFESGIRFFFTGGG